MFSVGTSRIELLEPTSPESPIAKALEKRGPGMHHIAYSVDSAESMVRSLTEKGVRMIDREPRVGAGGALIAFVHPSDSGRVLTELCQHSHSEKES
jgi:methylmalonyl-CoA/ethylmalonyl-CoA epimerase